MREVVQIVTFKCDMCDKSMKEEERAGCFHLSNGEGVELTFTGKKTVFDKEIDLCSCCWRKIQQALTSSHCTDEEEKSECSA